MDAQVAEHRHREHRERDRLVVRADPEYVGWIERLSIDTRTPIPVLIDQAIASWAIGRGHPQPPARLGGMNR